MKDLFHGYCAFTCAGFRVPVPILIGKPTKLSGFQHQLKNVLRSSTSHDQQAGHQFSSDSHADQTDLLPLSGTFSFSPFLQVLIVPFVFFSIYEVIYLETFAKLDFSGTEGFHSPLDTFQSQGFVLHSTLPLSRTTTSMPSSYGKWSFFKGALSMGVKLSGPKATTSVFFAQGRPTEYTLCKYSDVCTFPDLSFVSARKTFPSSTSTLDHFGYYSTHQDLAYQFYPLELLHIVPFSVIHFTQQFSFNIFFTGQIVSLSQ